MNEVLREEKKFLVRVDEFLRKSHQLEQVMHQDPHNGTHGYLIRSLYFDTPYDTDFREKQDGVEIRRKVRLRCYDPNQDYAMLELKQKQGARQQKRSLRVSRADALRLIAGDLSPLLRYREPFAAELYALMQTRCYRPKSIVQYHRKAFIARENRIRVTFDSRITATESSFDLFSPRLPLNPVLDPYLAVLEVKYNGFLLEYIKRMLNDLDKSELSVGKYSLSRQQGCLTRLQ